MDKLFFLRQNVLLFFKPLSFFLGITTTILFSSPSFSQSNNFSLPTHFCWQGFYMGGYVGGTWGGNTHTHTYVGTLQQDMPYFSSEPNIISVESNGSFAPNVHTFVGGVEVGNNWKFNQFVYGIVGDFGSFNISDSHDVNNVPYPTFPATYNIHTALHTDWLLTLRGRLGMVPYAHGPFIYATGGGAMTKIYIANEFNDNAESLGAGGASNNETKTGWTVGAGIEMPLSEHVTFNTEYLYVNFGSVTAPSSIAGATSWSSSYVSPFLTSTDLKANIVRFALNYKF